ncbi:hypothetical protein [Streptomyces sp. NPDC086766]|uniref:hypothetical protein n=1 Tax=Streptomyces sp. NPDC086766 TaxID=3365754 RepID=UPI0037F44896
MPKGLPLVRIQIVTTWIPLQRANRDLHRRRHLLHLIEGMVLTGMGVALAATSVGQDKPLYTAGGVLLALVCSFGTFAVVRDDRREKAAAEAGAGP